MHAGRGLFRGGTCMYYMSLANTTKQISKTNKGYMLHTDLFPVLAGRRLFRGHLYVSYIIYIVLDPDQ